MPRRVAALVHLAALCGAGADAAWLAAPHPMLGSASRDSQGSGAMEEGGPEYSSDWHSPCDVKGYEVHLTERRSRHVFQCSGSLNASAPYAVWGSVQRPPGSASYRIRACRSARVRRSKQGRLQNCTQWLEDLQGANAYFLMLLLRMKLTAGLDAVAAQTDAKVEVQMELQNGTQEATLLADVHFEVNDRSLATAPPAGPQAPATRCDLQDLRRETCVFWDRCSLLCANATGGSDYTVTGQAHSRRRDKHSLRVCRAPLEQGKCASDPARFASCTPQFVFGGDHPETFSVSVASSPYARDCVVLDFRNLNGVLPAHLAVNASFRETLVSAPAVMDTAVTGRVSVVSDSGAARLWVAVLASGGAVVLVVCFGISAAINRVSLAEEQRRQRARLARHPVTPPEISQDSLPQASGARLYYGTHASVAVAAAADYFNRAGGTTAGQAALAPTASLSSMAADEESPLL
eukprot:TRINITY_DN25790_c0_g1_i1.p1 TRINITY_DN25790_c0_g1~~TRINITY_DN25790_c0_g1_i1.p1  ORF type:complete len:486 (+),score=97.51 TRINITY_DN25790_c0_g1_i1:72-1460(+)